MDEKIAKSRAQEVRFAAMIGGTLNAGSGNQWRRKNDIRTDEPRRLLVECKRTDKHRITITETDLDDVIHNAAIESRAPLMHIEIGNKRYVMMPETTYMQEYHDAPLHDRADRPSDPRSEPSPPARPGHARHPGGGPLGRLPD